MQLLELLWVGLVLAAASRGGNIGATARSCKVARRGKREPEDASAKTKTKTKTKTQNQRQGDTLDGQRQLVSCNSARRGDI
jgi:hypothetical protein